MPTVFSHPAPMVVFSAALGWQTISWRLVLFGVFCCILPDLDVLGFRMGISYDSSLGHRGFSHSLAFAFMVGLIGVFLSGWLRTSRLVAFCIGFFSVCSHIVLDALTNGGLGVAVLWPLEETRYFFPWRPIQVSPFSPRAFLGPKGWAVLRSEALWVWLPCLILALGLSIFRATRSVRKPQRYRYSR